MIAHVGKIKVTCCKVCPLAEQHPNMFKNVPLIGKYCGRFPVYSCSAMKEPSALIGKVIPYPDGIPSWCPHVSDD